MRNNTTAFFPGRRFPTRHAQLVARVVFIAALLALVLYACGGNNGHAPPRSAQAPQQTTEASGAPSPPSPPLDSNGTYSETILGNRQQPHAEQNATAGQIMLPGLPYGAPDAESHDLEATACIQAKDHMGKNMQELQDILHTMVQQKLLAAALGNASGDASGDVSGNTAAARPAQPADHALLSGLIIDMEGYYNGKQFGELCVDAKGKLSQALMAQYQKKRLSLTHFCYSNPQLADNELRPRAMAAALQHLAGRQDPRLGALRIEELRDFLSQITVSNENLNIQTHQICLDITAEYDPMQARRTLQSHVLQAAKEQAPDKAPELHLAHYRLYLDITPYPVGQPMPDYGKGISVVDGAGGKALSLNGITSGWAVFTSLNQAGKDVPSALENHGKAPGPEDRFAFSDHPIGDFNATIQIAYNIDLTPADSPLDLDLLEFEYQDYVIQSVRIHLTVDEDKRKHVSFDLGATRTDAMLFDWGHKPVALTLQKQNNVLKIFVEKQFIISVHSPLSPLYSISVNLLNDSQLYALNLEGEQARPQPQQPTGVAGMIPYSTKWKIPELPTQQPGPGARAPAASAASTDPDAQQPAPGEAPQQPPAAKEAGK